MTATDHNRLMLGWQKNDDNIEQPHLRVVPAIQKSSGSPYHRPPVYAPEDGHIATFAPPGPDIKKASLIPNLRQYLGTVILVESSGELYKQTHQHRRAMGQEVYLLDPFGVTGEKSESLNVLCPGNQNKPPEMEDYFRLASIFISREYASELFIGQATEIIAAAFMTVARTSGPRNILAVYDFLNRPLEAIIKDVTYNKPTDHSKNRLGGIFQRLLRGKSYEAHDLALGWLSYCLFSKTEQATSHTSFPVSDLNGDKPLTLYMVIPPEQMEPYGPMIRLWLHYIGQLIEQRPERPEVNTVMFLEDTARYITQDLMISLMQIPPEAGLQVWSFWHNLKQIEHIRYNFVDYLTHNLICLQTYGKINHKTSHDIRLALTSGFMEDITSIPENQQNLKISGQDCFTCYRLDSDQDKIFKFSAM